MRVVQSYMLGKQETFRTHPFFLRLQRNDCPTTLKPYASALTFWVMTFQDILRLNEAQVTDAKLRRVAACHRAEDAGHDRWFLEDLLILNGSWPDVPALFSEQHQPVRDAAYALVSELYRAQNDFLRMVLLLTLESAGHAFFEQIAAYHERVAPDKPLKYFARMHLCAEQQHEMFEEDLQDFLASVVLSDEVVDLAIAMVDRVYEAFGQMFRCIEDAIVEYQRVHHADFREGPCDVCGACTSSQRSLTPPAELPPV